jgi:transcription initiation factor IIE alpha subunit
MKDELFVEAIQDQLEDLLKKIKYDGDVVTKMKKAPIPKGSAQKGEIKQQVRTKQNSAIKIKKYLQQRDVIQKRTKVDLTNKTRPKSKLNDAKRFKVLMENSSPFKKRPKILATQAKQAKYQHSPKLVLVSVAKASPLTDM